MNPISFFLKIVNWYYKKIEDFIIKDEPDQNTKIKKKMAVYYSHLLGIYYIFHFFNPYVSRSVVTAGFISTIIYMLMIRSKYYSITVLFYHVYGLFGLYMASKTPGNFLRVIGVSLCQLNQTFMVTNSQTMRYVVAIANFLLVNKIQGQFDELVKDNNVSLLIRAVSSLQYSWPVLYFFNHFASTYMAKEYCKAIEASQQAQQELKNMNQELSVVNEKLKNTLSLLENKNRELNDAIKARELFIASVSHELRNPLNSMLGNIELLSLEVNDSKWLNMLDTCKICGEVLLGLINNILDVAKINAERLELNCQPTNFFRLIEKVWVVSTIKMREKGLSGTLTIAKDVPKYINMDSHRLNQILLNLIGNATKFTKTGFVKVNITWQEHTSNPVTRDLDIDFTELPERKLNNTAPYSLSDTNIEYGEPDSYRHDDREAECNRNVLQRIIPIKSFSQLKFPNKVILNENDSKIQDKFAISDPEYSQKRGLLKIEIIDSGCGISKTSLHRLFQPFSQADSSITRRFGGTGLGLYITKQLIEKMGGKITVDSRENIGSEFIMSIPYKASTKEEVENNPTEKQHREEVKSEEQVKALIVDDDPLNQMIMSSYFKKMNIQVDAVSNGQEALFKFKSKETNYYSLITMDLQMPVMDGLTACREIRKFEKAIGVRENIPIAIVTANCIDIEKNQCLDTQGDIKASYVFRKPFTFEECQSLVGAILAQRKNNKLYQGKRLGILITDDDSFNTMLLKECLEKHSFTCDVCHDGREAIRKVSTQHFDVVLMDCHMPHMDGYTAARNIRRKFPNIVMIGVTGDAREDCLNRAQESGMNSIETKPLNLKRLINNMKNIGNSLS